MIRLALILLLLWANDLLSQSTDTAQVSDEVCQSLLNRFDYYNALDCYLQLVDKYEDANNEDAYFEAKYHLAEIYLGLEYIREAAGIAAQTAEHFKNKNEELVTASKLLLSKSYLLLGENEKSKSVLAGVSSKSLRGSSVRRRISYQLLTAKHAINSGDTIECLALLDHSTQMCLDHDLSSLYPDIQYLYGKVLMSSGRKKDGLKSLLKASKVAKDINNLYLFEVIAEDIIAILAEYERYERAFLLSSERNAIRDSLFVLKKQEIASRMIAKYESQKKQKTIYDLKGEQRATQLKTRRSSLANYALMISFLAVLAAAYLIITFYQQKLSSNQIINTQKELISQQKFTELENNLKIESMQSMMKGQELERERVAKDLHDSLGGMLSAIKLRFDALHYNDDHHSKHKADHENLQELLDDACQEVRNISSNLQPGALEQLGLIEALSDLINKYERGSNIEIHFQHYGILDNKRMESFNALNVYRIIQELLNNVIKHAQANEVIVQLNRESQHLTIMVEDDGVGYDPSKIKEGMGSENVRSRVNFLKGDLNIDSVVGEGTTTLITFPV